MAAILDTAHHGQHRSISHASISENVHGNSDVCLYQFCHEVNDFFDMSGYAAALSFSSGLKHFDPPL